MQIDTPARSHTMTRTILQIENEMEIARMRMDHARDKLCEMIMAGNASEEARLEMVHAAAIEDYMDLKTCRAKMA